MLGIEGVVYVRMDHRGYVGKGRGAGLLGRRKDELFAFAFDPHGGIGWKHQRLILFSNEEHCQSIP